ncbi:MAG: MBL fold metallo-hydrolase [Clostridia bacterium]|nr:MBL fold metallo-hydrolase [Clostridia bacterium]
MEIISLSPTGFASNCFILHSAGEAFVIDPAISEKRILARLEDEGLTLKGILLTHGHFDHIWRAEELRNATGAPLYVHEADAEILTDSKKNAYATFTGGSFTISEADGLLREGDALTLGTERITVLHTPGHAKGSVCYDTGEILITGDTLFAQSFGRYDLYGGDLKALKGSLQRLLELASTENRWIYCGHGENSTLRAATDMIKYYF